VAVEPPASPGAARKVCADLVADRPHVIDGREHRDTDPESELTAAWGDPPLVLRCGVRRPPGLSATSEVVEVEGVDWFLVESAARYTFTTVGRAAFVELSVPTEVERSEATAPLVDLAAVIEEHDPLAPGSGATA